MMKIKYKNYTLEPEGRRFNLYKTVKANKIDKKTKKPTGEVYDREENYGYGMSFDLCIETIISDSLCEKNEELSLRQYIDEYKELKSSLIEEIK